MIKVPRRRENPPVLTKLASYLTEEEGAEACIEAEQERQVQP